MLVCEIHIVDARDARDGVEWSGSRHPLAGR